MMDKIEQMIEEEVTRRLNEKLTNFVQYVSSTYEISLKILLRDVANLERTCGECQPSTSQAGRNCIGITAKGTRCTHVAKTGDYCGKHRSQMPKTKTKVLVSPPSNAKKHTHDMSTLFMKGCPACDSSQHKLLIEI